ncbi:hypothetical protein ES707_16607 [subsurface metagenome]
MVKSESLLNKIEEWVEEGLISHEQAEALKQREIKSTMEFVPARRVGINEIFVYLGSLVIFLALAFLVSLNWKALGSVGRILSILIPTIIMLVLGWLLRSSDSIYLKRGAQALWLGGCLLSGLTFWVIFYELDLMNLQELGPSDPWVLLGCLLATVLAGAAFIFLPSITQSITFHLWGSILLSSFIGWLGNIIPRFNHFYENLLLLLIGLIAGGLWLVLSEWLRMREKKSLVWVSQIFGALTILSFTGLLATDTYGFTWWQEIIMVGIAFLASIAFIVISVKKQSRIFLYCGAAFLLFIITYVNFEHFADKIGMPIALFITGVLLIGVGLGTGRLRRRIQVSK